MMKFLKSPLTLLIVFIALSFLLYGNSINGDFVWDDRFYSDRPELRDPAHLWNIWKEPLNPNAEYLGTYRPLTTLAIALNFIIFGDSPISFHIINIALNGLAAFLMYLVVRELFQSRKIAFISSLIWLFLPIHTEAVANIKSRDEIMAAIFIFASWWAFLKSFTLDYPKRLNWLLVGMVLLYCAGLSKDMGIIAGVTILGMLLYQTGGNIRGLAAEILVTAGAGLAWLATRYAVLGKYALGSDGLDYISNPLKIATVLEKFWTPFKIVYIYIKNTFVPIDLSATYHFNHIPLVSNPLRSPETLTGIFLIGMLVYFIVSKKYRDLPLGVGAWIFISSYIPISRFVFATGGDIMAERWLYFPTAGLALIAGYLFVEVYKESKKITAAAFIILLATYGYVIVDRNKVWASEEALFQSMVHDAPQSLVGYITGARYYLDDDNLDTAKKLIEGAFDIQPEEPILWDLAAAANIKSANYPKAIEQASIALELDKRYIPANINLGRAYYHIKNYEEANKNYQTALAHPVTKLGTSDVLIYAETLVKTKDYQSVIDFLSNKKFAGTTSQERADIIVAAAYYRLKDPINLDLSLEKMNGQSRQQKLNKVMAFLAE